MFTPVGFNVLAALSSRTFGDRTEGGVPNSSPSEPRSESWEGRGFDLVGVAGARSATLRAGRRDGSRRSTVRINLQKLYSRRGRKIFRVKPLVRAKTVSF